MEEGASGESIITVLYNIRMAIVNFERQLIVCVGAAKAGTSSLHSILAKHPAIAVSNPKETDFFIARRLHNKNLDYYFNKYFTPRAGETHYFESDPIYLYDREGIRNIHCLAPNARIVVMLRHPVQRAFSQYHYRMTYFRYSESFEKMCALEAERVQKSDRDRLEFGCIDRSTYAPQIAEVFKYFPREQVYFILFESFVRNQEAEVNAMLKWLGLESMKFDRVVENPGGKQKSWVLARLLFHPNYRVVRSALSAVLPRRLAQVIYQKLLKANFKTFDHLSKPRLNDETLKSFTGYFIKDIEAVQAMTGLDLSGWLDSKRSN